ncbi:unnamed protein product [Lathyrus oleraceus]
MDRSWIKTYRLGLVYENGVLEFLKFAKKMFLTIMVSFIVHVLFAGISKNDQRKKYYITYVMMEYAKIIQHGRGM